VDSLFSEPEIKKSLKNIIKSIEDVTTSDDVLFFQNLENLKFSSRLEQVVYEILISYLFKAETLSPGSFKPFLAALNDLSKNNKSRVNISTASKFSQDSLKLLLSTFSKSHIQDLVFEALQLSGFHGKVVLFEESTSGEKDALEYSSGSFFQDVFSGFNLPFVKVLNPRVICIDGFIESISEIHRVLEDASESKEQIILFVRGLSEDVLHTLKVNYDRGTLAVIPIIVKYEIHGINLLNDVAVVSGSDLISSLKGQLINSIDIFSFSRVDSVDITSTGVMIENKKTKNQVDLQIRRLQEKILESDISSVKEILTRRIQSLGINRTLIKLTDKDKKRKVLDVDRCLRAVKAAANHGIAQWEGKIYPLSSIKCGDFYANKFYKDLSSLGAVIV